MSALETTAAVGSGEGLGSEQDLLDEKDDAIAGLRAHIDGLNLSIEYFKRDAKLLAWVLAHPETAAEELAAAAAGNGTARGNLERRMAGIALYHGAPATTDDEVPRPRA